MEHGDRLGNKGVIGAGDVQRMTAGTGSRRGCWNESHPASGTDRTGAPANCRRPDSDGYPPPRWSALYRFFDFADRVHRGATLYLLLTTVSGSVLYYAARKRAAAMCIPSLKTNRFRPSASAAYFFSRRYGSARVNQALSGYSLASRSYKPVRFATSWVSM